MTKAYDIALIPPTEVMGICMRINESISERKNIDFRVHRQLPHITLLMGGVRNEDFAGVKTDLEEIAKGMQPIEITLGAIHVGEFASGIVIEPNEKLHQLHEKIYKKFVDKFSHPVKKDGVVGLPHVTTGTVEIINNFLSRSALENYDPHITIGDGAPRIEKGIFPLTFSTQDLRIAQMGNYCTFVDEYSDTVV